MALKEEFAAAIGTAGNKQSTFRTYWAHVSAFICFVSKQKQEWTHPKDIGHEWIKPFLTEMYATKGTAAKTRNQALSALKFLYENLLKNPIDDDLCKGLRAKQSKYARRILIGKPDLAKLLSKLRFSDRLFVGLMYGGAMRLSDVVKLRVKELQFDQEHINVFETKHDHFRSVPFPRSLHEAARQQIAAVSVIHKADESDNPNGVPLPGARRTKAPGDARDLGWYWLFPSKDISRCKETGFVGRYHEHPDAIRKRFKAALRTAGIDRRITPHDVRRTSATRMHFDLNVPLARLQYILGHKSLEQTRDYILEDEVAINGNMSPLDDLPDID